MKDSIKIVITAILLLLVVSCQKEPDAFYEVPPQSGIQVEVELCFKLKRPTAPKDNLETKSGSEKFIVEFGSEASPALTKSSGSRALHNLYVFQFKPDGNLAQQPVLIDEVTTPPTYDMVQLPITLTVGTNQTIYLVALGSAITDNLKGIRSLSELESYPFSYLEIEQGGAQYISKIQKEEDVPFAGKIEGVNVIQLESKNTGLLQYNVPEGFFGGVQLHRLMSKVTLDYTYDVNNYVASGVRLKSVPMQFQIKPQEKNSSISYTDLNIQLPNAGSSAETNSAEWYIAPNQWGVVDAIAVEAQRYRLFNEATGLPITTAQGGAAPPLATCFEVWAKEGKTSNYAIYQIYIGSNNTSNFNIDPNSYYTLSTLINADVSSSASDKRVRSFTVNQAVQFYATEHINSGDQGASPNPPGYPDPFSDYDLDAHYDSRPVVINSDGRIVTLGIYTDSECTTPASADAWLQVSPYPNYTAAKNSNTLSNSATLNVIVPSQLTLYLYNDEYIPKDLSSTEKRLLYVLITTATLGAPTDVQSTDKYLVAQRPPIPMGLLGGAFDENVGFTKQLVVDQISESGVKYTAVFPYTANIKTKFGFYNQTIPPQYNAGDRRNGAKATRAFAENKSGLNVYESTILQTNGELYQYNYYNTYPARYCYDRNRDLDGNGVIDDNELKWYLPAIDQLAGAWIQDMDLFTPFMAMYDYTSATVDYGLGSFSEGKILGTLGRRFPVVVRCVREID